MSLAKSIKPLVEVSAYGAEGPADFQSSITCDEPSNLTSMEMK
jgi:hypothetical protein